MRNLNDINDIPVIFSGEFPSSYVNNVAHWGNYSPDELSQSKGRLLHLDLDFGNKCSLSCPHCFRRDQAVDSCPSKGYLSEQEIIKLIQEGKKLGLKSVKILGRGEPFENTQFLGFLRKMSKLIGVSIFSKGHVIGSDELAQKYNSKYGIYSGLELAHELKKLGVSILLGFNSFDSKTQIDYVGGENSRIKNYVELRDQALLNLVEAGLNEFTPNQPTKLALISAPIKPENMEEVFSIFTWARKRNLYSLSCPSTVSGKGITETDRANQVDPKYVENLKTLYTKIYKWCIEKKITSPEQIREEGISLYPGCHNCTQVMCGMYILLSGKVVRCPGRCDAQSTFSEDIRKSSLIEVWEKSENYKRSNGRIKSPEKSGTNFHCPARDGRSLPHSFYEDIKKLVLK